MNDTGVTRKARPAKSPKPLASDKAVAVQLCAQEAGSTPATSSLWSPVHTSASKASVSASVFQSTVRNGGVRICLAAASALSNMIIPLIPHAPDEAGFAIGSGATHQSCSLCKLD